MNAVIRYLAVAALVAFAIVLKVAADALPIRGAAGLAWSAFTYSVLMFALVFACLKLLEKKKPPESE